MNSCNYFFAEMGYRMGMDTLREYYAKFGLGAPTGIEIGDTAGRLPSQNEGENLAPVGGVRSGESGILPPPARKLHRDALRRG